MQEQLTDEEKAGIKQLAKMMVEGTVNYVKQQQEERLKITDPERAISMQEQKDVMKRHEEDQTRIKQEKRKEKKEKKSEMMKLIKGTGKKKG